MAVRSLSCGLAGLLGPLMLVPLLMLASCQSGAPPAETVAAAPAQAPKPVRVAARPVRPRRPDAPCLTSGRKEELFRQFAAMQDGDAPDTALAVESPSAASAAPQPSCKQAEK